jgi:hypothetical protein
MPSSENCSVHEFALNTDDNLAPTDEDVLDCTLPHAHDPDCDRHRYDSHDSEHDRRPDCDNELNLDQDQDLDHAQHPDQCSDRFWLNPALRIAALKLLPLISTTP